MKIQLRNSKSNTCITYKGNNLGLVGQFCDGTPSQQFQPNKNSDGSYTFTHIASGYNFGVQGLSLDDGVILSALKSDPNNDELIFAVTKVGADKYSVNNVVTQKCIDLENGNCNAGAKIHQTSCDSTSGSQLWYMEQPIIYSPTPVDNSPSSDPHPPNGPEPGEHDSIQIQNGKTGLCVTYRGNSSGLIADKCVENSVDQQFKVTYNYDSTYTISHVGSKQNLDVPNGSSDRGSIIWTFTPNNNSSQKSLISNSTNNTWVISNSKSGMCMDMDCRKRHGGNPIDQWDCSKASKSQQWIFNKYTIVPAVPKPIIVVPPVPPKPVLPPVITPPAPVAPPAAPKPVVTPPAPVAPPAAPKPVVTPPAPVAPPAAPKPVVTPPAPVAPAQSQIASNQLWTKCADENGQCSQSNTVMRFGKDLNWFFKDINGNVGCNDATFGDPMVGTVKECDLLNNSLVDFGQKCADENGNCAAVNYASVMRYGQNGKYFYKYLAANQQLGCNNGVFGDSNPGVVKSCWIGRISGDLSTTWNQCANENGTCSKVSYSTNIRYGQNGKYFYKSFPPNTDIGCNNGVFGDSNPGVVKTCWIQPQGVADKPWNQCANENGTCSKVNYPSNVRYGQNGKYFYKTYQSNVDIGCNNGVFGDPNPGTVKTCWIQPL